MYDTEEFTVPKQSADSPSSDHNRKVRQSPDKSTVTAARATSSENNNVIEPERIPVRKLMENVSSRVNGHTSTTTTPDMTANGSMSNGVLTNAVENGGSVRSAATTSAAHDSHVGNGDSTTTTTTTTSYDNKTLDVPVSVRLAL